MTEFPRYFGILESHHGCAPSRARRPACILPANHVDLALLDKDAGYYLRVRESGEALCAYEVKCLFILQPIAVLEHAPTGGTPQ